jgi:hypothetical protein
VFGTKNHAVNGCWDSRTIQIHLSIRRKRLSRRSTRFRSPCEKHSRKMAGTRKPLLHAGSAVSRAPPSRCCDFESSRFEARRSPGFRHAMDHSCIVANSFLHLLGQTSRSGLPTRNASVSPVLRSNTSMLEARSHGAAEPAVIVRSTRLRPRGN